MGLDRAPPANERAPAPAQSETSGESSASSAGTGQALRFLVGEAALNDGTLVALHQQLIDRSLVHRIVAAHQRGAKLAATVANRARPLREIVADPRFDWGDAPAAASDGHAAPAKGDESGAATGTDAVTLLAQAAAEEPPAAVPHLARFEQAYRTGLGDVHAHLGGPKTRSALRTLGAQGAAHRGHVFFATPNPDEHLVGHELAHVVQRRGGTPARDGASAGPARARRNGSREELEAEAEAAVGAALRGAPVEITLTASTDDPLYARGATVGESEVHVGPASRLVRETLPRGSQVEIVGDPNAQWLHVRYAGGEGYILGSEIVISDSRAEEPTVRVPAWMRPQPSGAHPRLPDEGAAPAASGSAPAATRFPYQAQITARYTSIRSVAQTNAAAVHTFGDVSGIFVNVLREADAGWVEVDYQGQRGFLPSSTVRAVDTANPEGGVEHAILGGMSTSESSGQAGHYTTDSNRDNVGLGSWTQGRIAQVMDQYVAVAREADQEAATQEGGDAGQGGARPMGPNEQRLYGYFGGQARFNAIRARFLRSVPEPTREHPDFRLSTEEREMFVKAGREFPLIRRAEERRLHLDFVNDLHALERLQPPYPFVDSRGTVSEVAIAVIVHATHMWGSIGRPYARVMSALGGPDGARRRGETAFLDALREDTVHNGYGNRSASYQQAIRNRFLEITTTFGGSSRRYPVSRSPSGGAPRIPGAFDF